MDLSMQGGSWPHASTTSTGSKVTDGINRITIPREGTTGASFAVCSDVDVSSDQAAA